MQTFQIQHYQFKELIFQIKQCVLGSINLTCAINFVQWNSNLEILKALSKSRQRNQIISMQHCSIHSLHQCLISSFATIAKTHIHTQQTDRTKNNTLLCHFAGMNKYCNNTRGYFYVSNKIYRDNVSLQQALENMMQHTGYRQWHQLTRRLLLCHTAVEQVLPVLIMRNTHHAQ